ncbi:HAD-IA family hydrolase [Spirillospora sp. NPDC048911]|uniref:HAD-IA family hydrolase n=1 Tax=Spirillospora sp. NPDC048911 TaxID=3364527 RepID=UPI00371B696F
MGETTAVVFDLGGVLAHPPKGPMAPPKDFFGPAGDAGGTDQADDHPWHRLERGDLTLEEALTLLFEDMGVPMPSSGAPLPPGMMPPGMPSPDVPPPGMPPPVQPQGAPGPGPFGLPLPPPFKLEPAFVSLAEDLSAAGLKLALCANLVRELEPLWWDLYPWPDLFTIIVRSYELGARKPDPLPYATVLERLGTTPAETVFVDDSARNLATAGTLGMVTVLADGPAAADRIRELSGLSAPSRPATEPAVTASPKTDDDHQGAAEKVLANLRTLARRLPERSAEIESARAIPRDIIEDLRDTGIFRALYPASLGGPGLSDPQLVEAIEILAAGDASVAWCAAIGLDAALSAQSWPDEQVREVFPSPDLITAAVLPPLGKGVRVADGFELTGRWSFASGIGHADRVLCGFLADGATPVWRIAVVNPGDVRIHDTWNTTGLRGTGSHDIEIRELLVPERHTWPFLGTGTDRADGFSLPADRVNAKMAGLPLGIGTAALQAAIRILSGKKDMMTRQPAAAHPGVRANVARAESLIEASRAYVHRSLQPGGRRGDAALARQFAHRSCREAVQLLYDTVGSAAVYSERTPLDRHLRDLTTACQHAAVGQRILEGVGELRLGGDPMSPFI